MAFKIPPSEESHLVRFLALSDDAVERLIAALGNCTPTLKRRDLAKQITAKTGIDGVSASSTVRVLIALYTTFAGHPTDLDQFVEDVHRALEKLDRPELRPKSGDWSLFKNRLKALLSFDKTLGITSKALEVSMEYQYWLCESRVLSEIRPVFNRNPDERPLAAVVSHVLKLKCHEGDEMRDFFIGLDSGALRKLAAA